MGGKNEVINMFRVVVGFISAVNGAQAGHRLPG